MIFEGYDNSIKIKNELIEKIDILKKDQKNIQIKIDEIIRKIQIEKKKKIEDLQKIKINIDLNHFPKKVLMIILIIFLFLICSTIIL